MNNTDRHLNWFRRLFGWAYKKKENKIEEKEFELKTPTISHHHRKARNHKQKGAYGRQG